VRVAFSGTHRVGKTTLVDALAERLPTYVAFEEPYRILEEDGYEFSDPPVVEDFERQLDQSIAMLADAPSNALFDRCPLDFIAYADVDEWIERARDAMQSIDLVVFVPIEFAQKDRKMRARVDDRLRTMILDDSFGLGLETLEVSGSVERRVQQTLAALQRR
jgi:predicted ATPase